MHEGQIGMRRQGRVFPSCGTLLVGRWRDGGGAQAVRCEAGGVRMKAQVEGEGEAKLGNHTTALLRPHVQSSPHAMKGRLPAH